ncbi:type 2 lanthipeptide synthetase LanM family protein [Hamadaea sp. NPDC050747]|uniref:type 2 lanthipeptide synthetase LanM family protein n=1 Tax=Hamadaea sp. NPDC050747 TaxID=3155789 RepID=UPI0033EE721F
MPNTTPQHVISLGLPWERGDRPALTGPWWARGLWLGERLQPDLPQTAGIAPPWADRRLRQWQDAYPELVADATVAHRTAFGITAEDLRTLVAEDSAALAGRVTKPGWAATAERIAAGLADRQTATPETGDWQAGFAAIVEPFVNDALSRLAEHPALCGATPAVDTDRVLAALRASLTAHLVRAAGRTLVLELNVMRVAGRLDGDTAAARFWSFVRLMRQPDGFADLLDEYAVLTRMLVESAERAIAAYAEFLDRFTADRALIVADLFDGVDPGRLTDVHMGSGDVHDGGRSVGLLTFETEARAVYKPRPMAIHRHFNDVLAWYADRMPSADLYRLKVVDRDTYGWTEFVAPQPCTTPDDADRYFHRLGALLALLHGLAATDFHYENLIAVADQPVPVDLESLFHVDLPHASGSELADGDPAGRALRGSVQRVGLLPAVLVGEAGVLDVGGMGADKDTPLPFKLADWDDAGTDEMRLVRVQRAFPGSQNRPALAGRDLDPADHRVPLIEGFRAGYETLLAHRDELLAADGLLARFADDHTRFIARATRIYATILSESTHPNVCRDALDRDRVFGLLGALASGDDARLALTADEWRDMWAGDVPLFSSRADSRDVWTTGGRRLSGLLGESGLDRATATLAELSPADLAEQEWIINATLATRSAGVQVAERVAPAASDAAATALASRALTQAVSVGQHLERIAYRDGGRVGWLGLELTGEVHWSVSPLRADLYNGYPGVALFFAQLAQVTGERRYADLTRAVMAPFGAHADFAIAQARRVGGPVAAAQIGGAFSGLVGMAYAVDSAAVLLGEPELTAPVDRLLTAATTLISQDTAYDVISGAAGCLAAAEALVERHDTAGDLARACVQVLVTKAVPMPGGVAWPGTLPADQPLLGFSHGAGGIGWALLRHAARTGDEQALSTGYAAMAYESGEFRDDIQNWPDYRQLPSRPWVQAPAADAVAHMHAWCHGAPGIGLARVGIPAAVHTPQVGDDLRRAVESTAAFGHFGNHSLCHGDLGNLELLSAAADAGIDGAARHRDVLAEAIVADIERQGPQCGTPGNAATPGLLTGLAGIGHGLLRLAAPDAVAPVLLLAAAEAR